MSWNHPKTKTSNVFWKKRGGGFFGVNGAYTASAVLDPFPGFDDVYWCTGVTSCGGTAFGVQKQTEAYYSFFTAQSGIRFPSRKVQVTEISCPIAGALLAGGYIEIYSAGDETEYYIWFNVDAGTTDPAPPGGKTGIEVAVSITDTPDEVAAALRATMDGYPDFIVSDKSLYTLDAADQRKVILKTQSFESTTASNGVLWTGGLTTVDNAQDGPEKSAHYRFGGEAEEADPPDPNTPIIERTTEDPANSDWSVVPESIPPVYESGNMAGSLSWQGPINDKIRTISWDCHANFADRHMGKPGLRNFHRHPYNDERENPSLGQRSKEYIPLDIADPKTPVDYPNLGNVRDFLDIAKTNYIIYENGFPAERVPTGFTNLWGGSVLSLTWSISGVCLRDIKPAFPGDTNPDIGLWVYAMMYFGNYWDNSTVSWDACGTLSCGFGGGPCPFGVRIYPPRLVLLRKRYRREYAPSAPDRVLWEDQGWAYGVTPHPTTAEDNPNPWQHVGDFSLDHPDINWHPAQHIPGTWRGGFSNSVFYYPGNVQGGGFGGEANHNSKAGHFSPDGNQFAYLQQYMNWAEYWAGSCSTLDPPRNLYQWSSGRIFPPGYWGNAFARAKVICNITDGDSGAVSGFIDPPRYIEEKVQWDYDITTTIDVGDYTGPYNGADGISTHEHLNPTGGGNNGSIGSNNGSQWVALDWDYDGNLVEIYLTKTWDWSDSDAPTEPYIEEYEIIPESVTVNPDFECEDPPCDPPPPPCESCGCATYPLTKDHRRFEYKTGKDVTWHLHGLTPSPLVVKRELIYRQAEGFWHWSIDSVSGPPPSGCLNQQLDVDITRQMIKFGYSSMDRNVHAAGPMIHCLDARSKSAVISQNVTPPLRSEVYNDAIVDLDGACDYKTEVIVKGQVEHTYTYTTSGAAFEWGRGGPANANEYPRANCTEGDIRSLIHDDKDSISLNWHFNHRRGDFCSPSPSFPDRTPVNVWQRDGNKLNAPPGQQAQWHWNEAGDFTFGYAHYQNLGGGQCRSRLTEQGVSVIFTCPGLPVLLRRGHYDEVTGYTFSPPSGLGLGYGDDSLTGGPEWLQGWWFGDDANGDDEVDITVPLGLLSGDGDYGVWTQLVTV